MTYDTTELIVEAIASLRKDPQRKSATFDEIVAEIQRLYPKANLQVIRRVLQDLNETLYFQDN